MADTKITDGEALVRTAGALSPKLEDDKAQSYMNKNNAISEVAENNELNKLDEQRDIDWKRTKDEIETASKQFDNVEEYTDKMPNFLSKMYKNGEFGEPGSKDAKARMGYFIVNHLGSALKQMSNAFSQAAGKGQVFSDTTSELDKLRSANLQKGIETSWKKREEKMNFALDTIKKQGATDEEAKQLTRTLSRNARLNNAIAMMDENKAVYALNVVKEVGGYIGNLNTKEFVNFIQGAISTGKYNEKQAAVVAIAKFAPDMLEKFAENNNLTGIMDLIDGAKEQTGSLFDFGGKKSGGITDVGLYLDKEEIKKLQDEGDKLYEDYESGNISKEEFLEKYTPLYNAINKPGILKDNPGTLVNPKTSVKNVESKREQVKKESEKASKSAYKEASEEKQQKDLERSNEIVPKIKELEKILKKGKASADQIKEYDELVKEQNEYVNIYKLGKTFKLSSAVLPKKK